MRKKKSELSLQEEVLAAVLKKDPAATGNLFVKQELEMTMVTGTLSSSKITDVSAFITEVMESLRPGVVTWVHVRENKPNLSVAVDGAQAGTAWKDSEESVLDEVKTLFIGTMPLTFIKETDSYKRLNYETLEKVKNIVTVTGVIVPLILDRNLKIIDGALRLEVAKILELSEVPVMVLDCDDVKADFLRMSINRVSEFQRWKYDEIDPYVDSKPQLQPLLEPIGFFSNNILPVSFFGDTVLNYVIDEYNDQMAKYSQDLGLAEWAKMRRDQLVAEEEAKKARRNKKPSTEGVVSLFDLQYSEDDFLETYKPYEAIAEHVEKMKEVAGRVTENFDVVRKAEKEARGHAWQTSRRSSKGKAADKRAEAEAKAAEEAAAAAVDEPVEEPTQEGLE